MGAVFIVIAGGATGGGSGTAVGTVAVIVAGGGAGFSCGAAIGAVFVVITGGATGGRGGAEVAPGGIIIASGIAGGGGASLYLTVGAVKQRCAAEAGTQQEEEEGVFHTSPDGWVWVMAASR